MHNLKLVSGLPRLHHLLIRCYARLPTTQRGSKGCAGWWVGWRVGWPDAQAAQQQQQSMADVRPPTGALTGAPLTYRVTYSA